MRPLFLAIAALASALAGPILSPDDLQQFRLDNGLDAFARHEYAPAADLLHAYVFDADLDHIDARASLALGVMHQDGLGAAQDTLLACAFFEMAGSAEVNRHCGSMTPEQVGELGRELSFFRLYPPSLQFDLIDGGSVVFDRARVTVTSGLTSTRFELPIHASNAIVLPAIHHRAGLRDYFEVFYWSSLSNARKTHTAHSLNWSALEIRDMKVSEVAGAEVLRTADLSFPALDLTREVERLVERRTNGDDFEWLIHARPPYIVHPRR